MLKKIFNTAKVFLPLILIVSLLAYAFINFLFYFLFDLKWFSEIWGFSNKNILWGSKALSLIVLLISWNRMRKYWVKYRNTYKIKNPFFLYPDYIICLIFFSTLIGLYFYFLFKLEIKISPEVNEFGIFALSLLVLWFLTSYFWFWVGGVWSFIKSKAPFLKSKKLNELPNPVSDEPIQRSSADLLNRKGFVDNLSKEIEELPFEDPFVFGLYGDWGEGKSSVLNLLKEKLLKNKDFIVMNFDPWNFSDEEAINAAFFSELEKSLSSQFIIPNLKGSFIKYQKLIASGLSKTGFSIDFDLKDETLDEVKRRLESYIQKTGKVIFISIDEIDRLQKEEILQIFKLVRANSRFKNIRFLLSFDYTATVAKIDGGAEYLEKIIQKPIPLAKIEQSQLNDYFIMSGHQIPRNEISDLDTIMESSKSVSVSGYIADLNEDSLVIAENEDLSGALVTVTAQDLQKLRAAIRRLNPKDRVFVQGIFESKKIILDSADSLLLPFRLSQLDLLLYRLLKDKKITPDELSKFDADVVTFYGTDLSKLITNLRDIKRFMNSLASSLPPIATEVHLFDFFLLEFIKVFAKEVYDDIYENWWFYVSQRSEGEYVNNPFALLFSREQEQRRKETNDHLSELLAPYKYKPIKEKIIRSTLHKLFPILNGAPDSRTSAEDISTRRIFTTAFIKYFTLSVPSQELSDEYMNKTFKAWSSGENQEEEILTTFKNLKKSNKILQFLNKTNSGYIPKLSIELSKKLIRVIYKNTKIFEKKGGDFWSSEYDRAFFMVMKLIEERIPEGEINNFIKNIIQRAQDLHFVAEIVLIANPDRNGDYYKIYSSVNHEELREAALNRFRKEILGEGVNIFEEYKDKQQWRLMLHQWSTNWGHPNEETRREVNDFVLQYLAESPEKFVEFLRPWDIGSFEKDWSINIQEFSKGYDVERFKVVAKEFLQRDDLTEEQGKMLKVFIKKAEELVQ